MSQWESSCAQLLATSPDLSFPGWCDTYNYGVFFGVVFGAAGLILIGAPFTLFVALDKAFNVGARWIDGFVKRRA